MAKKTLEQIEQLKKRKAQLEARLQMLQGRQRVQERRKDTRRKVLVGAAILSAVETEHFSREELVRILDGFLTRPFDRALFDLPER